MKSLGDIPQFGDDIHMTLTNVKNPIFDDIIGIIERNLGKNKGGYVDINKAEKYSKELETFIEVTEAKKDTVLKQVEERSFDALYKTFVSSINNPENLYVAKKSLEAIDKLLPMFQEGATNTPQQRREQIFREQRDNIRQLYETKYKYLGLHKKLDLVYLLKYFADNDIQGASELHEELFKNAKF